jgi:hypothetical protein
MRTSDNLRVLLTKMSRIRPPKYGKKNIKEYKTKLRHVSKLHLNDEICVRNYHIKEPVVELSHTVNLHASLKIKKYRKQGQNVHTVGRVNTEQTVFS